MGKNIFKDMTNRRDFIKTAAKFGVSISAISVLSACINSSSGSSGQGSSSDTNGGKVTFQTFGLENPGWIDIDNGIKDAIAALGFGMSYDFLAHKQDVNLQISQLEQAIPNGTKVLITYIPDRGAVPRVAKMCQENKIHMISLWTNPVWYSPLNVGDYYLQFAQPDGELMAYEVSAALFKKLGGKGTVIHIPGYPDGVADTIRTAGVDRALKEYPDIKLVRGQQGGWNRTDTRKSLEDVLVKVDHVDGAIGQNDDQAAGIVAVLKERKIKAPVVGIDGVEEAFQYIREGSMYATHCEINPYIGGRSVVALFDALNGWKPSIPERMIVTESVLVTKENVDHVAKRMGWGAKKTGFDWKKMSRILNPDSWDPQMEIKPLDPWKFWNGQKVEPGMGLPKEYEKAKSKGEWEKVTQMYAEQYKMKLL
ncbi:sugar ABC transporter substrate-binding protein [Fictibacillus enclensis]|uniref:sugar ABC transporter substrate-binding protein n=1 Tax=Fictibacillus enclensis TaxID=1017270 RepID=UPI0025A22E41|nr:sugar ABC transporter substrate-binding protein [Fictibacillus enclensis]MDM5198982.1 sugar ABC transporter substrate-binding protein [Fictibacillus enclensis]